MRVYWVNLVIVLAAFLWGFALGAALWEGPAVPRGPLCCLVHAENTYMPESSS